MGFGVSNKQQIAWLADWVDKEVEKHFTKEILITASAGVQVVSGSLYRWNKTGELLDEEAMLIRLYGVTGSKKFQNDYQLVKLAREKGLAR